MQQMCVSIKNDTLTFNKYSAMLLMVLLCQQSNKLSHKYLLNVLMMHVATKLYALLAIHK